VADLSIEAVLLGVEVGQSEADEVAEGAVETVLNLVLSSNSKAFYLLIDF
jgi:hypothetical protein